MTKTNKPLTWAVITTIIGIIGWIIFFSIYQCTGDMCGLGAAIMFFIALLSIIGFWLVGLFIGSLSSKKERPWYIHSFIVLGIILVLLIISYIIRSITS